MPNTIVVSGGTKGLGRAICEIFAREGYTVFTCARTEADLTSMHPYWEQHFPQSALFTFPADCSKKSEVLEFADFVKQHCDQVNVLVNNAGLFLPGLVTEESEGILSTLLEVNLFSAYHLTRALLTLVPAQGHIFNMCSVASLQAYPMGGSYSIAKFALLGFNKVLREELKPKGIKVTALMPGATWSDSWQGADLPYERLMQPDDIAKIVWMAAQLSPAAVIEDIIIRPQLGDL
jgi:short-subunit dehydrogenase